jgi:uncharacterized protein (TIGR00369 family)
MEELQSDRKEFLIRDFGQGFIRHCGFIVQSMERGRLVSAVEIRPEHRQQDGFIHAGVMATLADHSAGYAAFTLVPDDCRILTIEFKINFLYPAFGDRLTCRSRIIREGGQILVGESEVFDARDGPDVMVAKAIVTLASVHRDRVPPCEKTP